MKKITILSGKGGVGKSTIAASLAIALSKDYKVVCADCDVDAPNLALIFGVKGLKGKEIIKTSKKARIVKECKNYKKLINCCMFNAIEDINGKALINRYLCEGCKTCSLVFPKGSIELYSVENATVGYAHTKYDITIVSGELKTGESGSGKVVVYVKALALSKDADILIADAAAGIGCPVIASVSGSDYVIAVTEPTPSGFSDLQRALGMVNHFKIPHCIIINKHNLNPNYTKKIEAYAKKNNIKILAKIPYDKSFVYALVNLTPIIVYKQKFKKVFNNIASKLKEIAL